MRLIIVLLMFLAFGPAQATILPPNDLYLEDDIHRLDANIDEETFHRIINDIVAIYQPLVREHGAELKSRNNWTSRTVNASAQQSGSNWYINMYGGLARRPEVTPDGFALVVCHELGHHLAGFPLKGGRWAANEGQSDYFATQSCARVIWEGELEINSSFESRVNAIAKEKCDETWQAFEDRHLCYRSAMAGDSLAKLLGSLRNTVPEFETPSEKVVSRTSDYHPEAQCRHDTYFHGALCSIEFDPRVIPGRNHSKGQQSQEAEEEAARYSCTRSQGFETGTRRLCWFKPSL